MAKKASSKTNAKELTSAQDLYNFLFEACNILRGPVSQDNFKDYITPILYFKRISDVYDEETQAALIESGGDEEYASLPEQHRFVIPDGCHWIDVRERTERQMIAGTILDETFKLQKQAGTYRLYAVLQCEEMIARMKDADIFKDAEDYDGKNH